MDGRSDESVEPFDEHLDEAPHGARAPEEPLDESSEVPPAPSTGDPAIDEAMSALARAQSGSFAERIAAGERAHRMLQGRLDDLGGA